MPTTPIGAAPYPAGVNADAVPADMMALAVWASTRVNMRFADAAARNAAITSPTVGMEAWLDTPGVKTIYTSAGWKVSWSQLAWTDIDLGTDYATYGTTPQVAVENGLFIVFKGGIQRSTPSTDVVGGSLLGSIPSSLGTPVSGDYPVATQWLATITGRLYVGSDRTIYYFGPNVGWVSVNGVRVPLA